MASARPQPAPRRPGRRACGTGRRRADRAAGTGSTGAPGLARRPPRPRRRSARRRRRRAARPARPTARPSRSSPAVTSRPSTVGPSPASSVPSPRRRSSSPVPTADDAATTPRCRRRRPAGRCGRGAVGRGVAELAQQVDELLHVADEVAARELLVVEHVVERPRPPPTRGPARRSRRSGARVSGSPSAALVGVELGGQRVEALGPRRAIAAVGNHGAGSGAGAAVLVGEHEASPASGAGSRSSSSPALERLGDEQVALVVEAHQPLAPVGERPAVEVAPAPRAAAAPGRSCRASDPVRPCDPALAARASSRSRRSAAPQRPAGGGRDRGSRRPGASAARTIGSRRPPLASGRGTAATLAVARRGLGRRRWRRSVRGRRRPGAGSPGLFGAYGVGQLDRARRPRAARRSRRRRASGPCRCAVSDLQPVRAPPLRCDDGEHGDPPVPPLPSTPDARRPGAGRGSAVLDRRRPTAAARRLALARRLDAASRYSADVAALAHAPRPAARRGSGGAARAAPRAARRRRSAWYCAKRQVRAAGGPRPAGSAAPGWRPCCRSAGTATVRRKRAARRERRRPGRTVTNGDHSTTAWPMVVDAAPAGPAGELRVLARA